MLQKPNVYADISYILHGDQAILPLLKQTLANEQLKTKVLYGTDFFVVRNHKSDKNILADMLGGLSEDEFDLIARKNPASFLKRSAF
jgi:predicted TIM-barrel fold metal-dependent hydrolase